MRFHNPRVWGVICSVFATTLIAFAQQSQGIQNEMRKFDPPMTKVAILPVIDMTGEKEDQKRDQANAVFKEMNDQFSQRGFQIVDPTEVTKAIEEQKLDFNDEEFHRRDSILKVGEAVQADLVIFSVVTQAYAKEKVNLFNNEREGLAKTKTWFLDVKEAKPILSAYVWEGKSTGSLGVGQKGNRGRMGAACGNSIRDVLNKTLKDYKREKK